MNAFCKYFVLFEITAVFLLGSRIRVERGEVSEASSSVVSARSVIPASVQLTPSETSLTFPAIVSPTVVANSNHSSNPESLRRHDSTPRLGISSGAAYDTLQASIASQNNEVQYEIESFFRSLHDCISISGFDFRIFESNIEQYRRSYAAIVFFTGSVSGFTEETRFKMKTASNMFLDMASALEILKAYSGSTHVDHVLLSKMIALHIGAKFLYNSSRLLGLRLGQNFENNDDVRDLFLILANN